MPDPSRREILRTLAAAPLAARAADADRALAARLEAHRPSRLAKLPRDLPDRWGAAHVEGLYHFTEKDFFLEGAERLIALGTRLGKFWFTPRDMPRKYPWNHAALPATDDFVALSRLEPVRAAFDLPFRTIVLEALLPHDEAWRNPDPRAPEALDAAERATYDLAAELYRVNGRRELTFILQNWEGDWRYRGGFHETWSPTPEGREALAARMARWLAARQRGVDRARARFGGAARLRVAHAAEVNRVRDLDRGIPTVAGDVLPRVTLDLVSYSCYDALATPLSLAKAVATIRRHARTGPLFGPGAVMLGEIGLPENDRPEGIAGRWDGWLGVALALDLPYVVQWQLYCNEPRGGAPRPAAPVRDVAAVRGFGLVRPDGSLSATGELFRGLWHRACMP
jgi:hypothetical protein